MLAIFSLPFRLDEPPGRIRTCVLRIRSQKLSSFAISAGEAVSPGQPVPTVFWMGQSMYKNSLRFIRARQNRVKGSSRSESIGDSASFWDCP